MGHTLPLFTRLTASSQTLDAAALASETDKLPCRKLDRLVRGEHADVFGRVTSVRYTPTAHVPLLEAELFDGSASIALVWLGRRRIPGIEPGRRLIARGRIGLHHGRHAIYNPWYELQ